MDIPTTDVIDKARERACVLAAETGEPHVTILSSENSALSQGDVLSLSEADIKLAALDRAHSGGNYDKVNLSIDYIKNGKADSYEDCRFDIGDEQQGLVSHIKDYWEFYLENKNWRKRLESQHSPEYVEAAYDEYKRMANDVAPYFEHHLELSAVVAKAQTSDLSADELADVQAFVRQRRLESNGIELAAATDEGQHEEKSAVIEKMAAEALVSEPTTSAPLNYRDKVNKIRENMAQTILSFIENNPADWQRGWSNLSGAPINGKTGTAYRGINSLFLAFVGMSKGYTDPRWVTFNQAKDLGANIKKGEKSLPVLFFEFYDRQTKKAYDERTTRDMTDEERFLYEKENVYAVMKYSSVFNAEQCVNFPERDIESLKMSEEERANQNAIIETIIANSAAPVKYDGGNRAYYSPSTDDIHLPAIEAFNSMQDYYATALHEIAHSTGHVSRLNRPLDGFMDNPKSYAIEELRAELAGVFMQTEHGIQIDGKHIENHAAYVKSWLEAVKSDPQIFYSAVRDAEKIADYVSERYLQSVQVDELELDDENEAQDTFEHQTKADNDDSASIRQWYVATFPNDELGAEIKEKVTFEELSTAIENGEDVYELLGVADSIVRERAFEHLADIQGKPYGEIYDAYITNANTGTKGQHKEESQANGANIEHYFIDFKLNYGNEMLLSNALKDLGYSLDNSLYEINQRNDEAAIESREERWTNEIRYLGPAGKSFEGYFGRTFNGIMLEATSITGFTTTGLDASDVQAVANIIRDFGVDVDVKDISVKSDINEHATEQVFLKEESIEEARAQAQRLAKETGEPYVTFEWSERSKGFPNLQENTVMPLSAADKIFAELDAEALSRENTLKANLHIDYIFKGELNSYENLRFYIGSENGGIVNHIEEFSKNDAAVRAHIISVDEQQELKELSEYLKRHIQYSQDASMSEEMRLRERGVINSALPLILQRELEAEEQGEHKEENSAPLNEKRTDKTSVQNMSAQNRTDGRTVNDELANKPYWIKINLADNAVGKTYGSNTLVKMPEGEYSYYDLFVPNKFLKQINGKWQLTVGSSYTYKLNNDGKQVVLTGQELRDSFGGMQIGKGYTRVAPSWAYTKVLNNLVKNVPGELKNIPTWCCYRTKWDNEKGKKSKFIISPIDGKWANSKEPQRWVTFDEAIKYARENGCEGVSLLLDRKYGITCIDLDKCILDVHTGKMKERATKLVQELNGTYMERSTSGNGVHIFIKEDVLKNGTYRNSADTEVNDPRGDLEVFDDKRIISMTGDMISTTNELTRAGSAITVYLRSELGLRGKSATASSPAPRATSGQSQSDSEVIKRIRESKRGADFASLFDSKSGLTGDKSKDDYKLANLLLYFNEGDTEQAFRIMRTGQNYRPEKPDSYYEHTIRKANDDIGGNYAKRPNPYAAQNAAGKRRGGMGKPNANGGSSQA